MYARYPDELVCDMAETYHVYDWRGLGLPLAATLAAGLRDNSRVKMALAGTRADAQTSLLAALVDNTSVLVWQRTKDAEKGINRPKSVLAKLTGETEKKNREIAAYRTPEEFMNARQAILHKIRKG